MKKTLRILGGMLLAATTSTFAQVPLHMDGPKLEPSLLQFVETGTAIRHNVNGRLGIRSIKAQTPVDVIVNVSDADKVIRSMEREGMEAERINDNLLTARLTAQQLQSLSELPEVYYVKKSRQFRPLMVNTRKSIKANDVHSGKDLETPYTGEGVLVAVLDQGFQPRHLAFYDSEGQTRIKQWWNRRTYSTNKNTKPTTVIPTGGDGFNTGGHATHVANIAAGSIVEGSNYYGIAPKADLYLVASSFDETELLNDIQTIAAYAKKQEQPVVINMSLGSQMGPHDGSTPFDQGVSKLIDAGGVFVCGAMGNEGGQRIHASYTFKTQDEVKSVLFQPVDGETIIPGEIWEQNTNGQKNITFRPFYLVGTNKTYLTSSQMSQLYIYDSIDRYNNKHNLMFTVPISYLKNIGGTTAQFGVEMIGNEGETVHAWMEADYGQFKSGAGYLSGNSQYLVSEAGASIPHAFAIAAYAATNTYKSVDGYTYGGSQTGQTVGQLAYFSSNGPWLGEVNKPTIAAPGFMVLSAFNSYDSDFSATSQDVVGSVKKGSATYYYGQMSGTSMATPVATGTVALWLEANPKLTYEQIIDIFETTAVHDNYAKQAWDAKFGYGKIDAYAGLKKALEYAANGIDPVRTNSEAPVTLQKGGDTWRILFNSDERFADVSLYTADGKLVESHDYDALRRGEERTVSLQGLPAGVYLIRIHTAAAQLTRKVMVR